VVIRGSTLLLLFQWKELSRAMRYLEKSERCCLGNVPNAEELEEQKPAPSPVIHGSGLVPQEHLPGAVKAEQSRMVPFLQAMFL